MEQQGFIVAVEPNIEAKRWEVRATNAAGVTRVLQTFPHRFSLEAFKARDEWKLFLEGK